MPTKFKSMDRVILTLYLILIAVAVSAKRGGSSGSSKSRGKSGSSSSSSGSSYPKQQWVDPNSASSKSKSKTPSAPPAYPNHQGQPGYPGYPGQNPSYPNNQAPPSYSAPGHPYPAPPSYSAPGHPYPAPPGYPSGGHGYPSGGNGYPSAGGHGYPSGGQGYPSAGGQGYPSGGHGYPSSPHLPSSPNFPGTQVLPGKNAMKGPKTGIGTHVAAGVVGAVAGAALASGHHKFMGPRMKIRGGHFYNGYSSSEEYFDSYVVGPDGRIRGERGESVRELTDEEAYILHLAMLMEKLCGKLSQPAICTFLRLHGLKAFMHPNNIYNITDHDGRNGTFFDSNHFNFTTNDIVDFSEIGDSNLLVENKTFSMIPNQQTFPAHTSPSGTTPSSNQTHLDEERLKAAEDLIKALE